MKGFSRFKEVGKTTNTVVYIVESDPDTLIIVLREGTKDNAEDAIPGEAMRQCSDHG